MSAEQARPARPGQSRARSSVSWKSYRTGQGKRPSSKKVSSLQLKAGFPELSAKPGTGQCNDYVLSCHNSWIWENCRLGQRDLRRGHDRCSSGQEMGTVGKHRTQRPEGATHRGRATAAKQPGIFSYRSMQCRDTSEVTCPSLS